MFNIINNDDIKRILERMSEIDKRLTEFEKKLEELEARPTPPAKQENETSKQPEPALVAQLSSIIPNAAKPKKQTDVTTYYLAAPTASGVFSSCSPREQIGKSIYQLTTKDGINGSFVMLNTPDAIATAMISISQFIKSACKVIGNSAIYPRSIVTEEEGTATFQAGEWHISRKAVVHFE